MRYFLTTNASRSYTAGGFTFSDFEPVSQRGGSWLGVLAVADDAAASALAAGVAAGSLLGVDEISEERFNLLKKKGTANSTNSVEQRQNHPRTPGVNAKPAAAPGAPTAANSTECITAVTLLAGEVNVPRESLLEEPAVKRRRTK